jgi:hypothetical protein
MQEKAIVSDTPFLDLSVVNPQGQGSRDLCIIGRNVYSQRSMLIPFSHHLPVCPAVSEGCGCVAGWWAESGRGRQ